MSDVVSEDFGSQKQNYSNFHHLNPQQNPIYDNNSSLSNYSYILREKKNQKGKSLHQTPPNYQDYQEMQQNQKYQKKGAKKVPNSNENSTHLDVLSKRDEREIEIEEIENEILNEANEEKREENYQRLSNSINDLFANLLKELEKQKNKEFLATNQNEFFNSAKINTFLKELNSKTNLNSAQSKTQSKDYLEQQDIEQMMFLMNQAEKNSVNQNEKNNSNNNNNSNGSNKDSGFVQESFYQKDNLNGKKDSNLTEENLNKNSAIHKIEHNNQGSPKTSTNLSQNEEQTHELSLLERYLNSEQIIAYKHTQIEMLLHKFFVK